MKLGPDMNQLNTFNIPKHEGVNKWVGGGASKKPPENAMKLRESRLSHHLKPTQIMLKRRGFLTAIHNHLILALTYLEERVGWGMGGGGL